jgi:PAS domain S-box-containing protein
MKLFWKIFLAVYISFILVSSLVFSIISTKQIRDAENYIIEQNKIIGRFTAKEVERGLVESRWPFESLAKLKERKDFLFWWVVKGDAEIYLADRAAFMGTSIKSYFPQLAMNPKTEILYTNRSRNYGIFIRVLNSGTQKWSFWLGFSIIKVQVIKREIIFLTLMIFSMASLILGGMLYFIIKFFTKPLDKLSIGAAIIGHGDLNYRVNVESNDEIGELATSFNKMADDLQKTTYSMDYVNSILESMFDSLAVIDPEGIIKSINRATCTLLGYQKEELIGEPIWKVLMLPESIPGYVSRIIELFQHHNLKSLEACYRTKVGANIPVLFSASIIQDRTSNLICIVCTAKDITELKKAEEALAAQTQELTRSNIELEQFAYIASHDLKEPLRKITAFGDRLKVKYFQILDEQGKDYLDRIHKATERMNNLISDLLKYSRVTTKAQPFSSVDLNQVVAEVLSDLEVQIEKVTGRVEFKNLPVILADPIQMRQLFQNLINNALKFHKPEIPPVVEITAQITDASSPVTRPGELPPNHCEIVVTDNGIGIDERFSDRIFQIFQRLHGHDEYEGSGVGLAICRKIVERHNGRISFQSTLGQGTSFKVIIPLPQF